MQLLYDTKFVQDLLNKISELEQAVNATKSDQYYLNQLALLDDVIKEKDNQINELELALSRTEFEVAELTEEIEEKYNRISDLADTLDTIRSICEKGL